jgi:Tol biopolymer transport system component
MNQDKFGSYSLILGGISFFLIIMFALESKGPGIFVGSMSIVAIFFGITTFIKKGHSKIQATMGIILGSFCLIASFINVSFPEINLSYSKPGYEGVTFWGNSNIVGLRYCDSSHDCFIKYTYDVSMQKFSGQEAKINFDKYSFSRDGKKVLFVAGSEFEKNIFIMNTDGSERKQLTHSSDNDTIILVNDFDVKSMKVKTHSYPSFSPDGKRVIFVRHTLSVKKRSGVLYSFNCDIYAVDIESEKEQRLTNYNFDNVSRPLFLSDGKRFIFSASDMKREYYKDHGAKYHNSMIFIMDENNAELRPGIFHSEGCKHPSISFDDKIVFVADTGIGVERDVFIKIGNETKSLTNMKTDIVFPEISSDGKWIVFKERRQLNRSPYEENHFWIMTSDGTGIKELIPPKD